MAKVRDKATVTVSKPVKNQVPRKPRAKKPDRNGPVINVNPEVFAAAQKALRSNERIVIINTTTIITQYK